MSKVLANAGEFGDMLQQLMEAAKRQSLLLPAVMAFSHERHKMSFLSHASGDLDLILSAVLELNGLRQLSTSVTELTKPDANTKEDILNIVFQRKGVWLMCQKAERSMSFLDSRIERLSSIRRELAQRVFGTTSSMSSQAIEKLMTEQRDLERTLAATNRIDSMFTCVNVAEVSRCIPERACLIEFVYIHQVVPDLRDGLKHVLRRYVAAVVLPDSYCHGEQPLLFDFGALDEDIEQYMEFLSWNPNLFETLPKSVVRRKVADFFEAGHRLRERLFDRIRCRIPDLDHFIVAADGPLGKLPWQALPLQDDGYVLDLDLTISYVTSARDILTWSCEVPASACGCAVIADPTFEFPAASESSAAPQEGYQPEDDSVTVDRIIPISGKFVRVLSVGCEQSYVDQIIQQVCSGNPDSEQHGGGLGDSALRTAITQGTDRGACFGPLKHTRFEGEMVVKCLNQAAEKFYFEPTQSFFGEEASSLVLFKVGSLRILHIATRGFYLNPNLEQASREPCRFMRALKEGPYQDPWHWSGLAFAGAQTWLREGATKQSGILTAAEVRGLKLPHCELVTLSACHTGLGEMFPGEGVLGLTRAFQLAGAKRVLASQWAISDDATKDLMNAFYAELIETNEVGEALRRAQRKLCNRDGRAGWPLFWAGLKLIGNPAGTIFSASK